MKHLLYSIVFLVYTFGYSQDSLAYHQNKRQDPVSKHSQDSLQRIKTQVKDTILAVEAPINSLDILAVKVLPDSTKIKLQDMALARRYDSLWLDELYNNELFEQIYGSITAMTYEPVEYIELPTDTLKARLAEINSRTPFNVCLLYTSPSPRDS